VRIKPATEQLPEETSVEEPKDEILSNLVQARYGMLANSPELREVINGAMDGTLPLDKPLEVNQPQKLSIRAIQAILLSVGGYYTTTELAAISGMNYVYLTKLLKHPYSRRIITIATAFALEDLSALDRRLKRKSPKMLKVIAEIAENEQVESSTRLRAAFGWLDRAGLGETKKQEVKKTIEKRTTTVTYKRAELISTAITEALGPEAREKLGKEVSQPRIQPSQEIRKAG
jgi:hypothetical protein